MHGAPLSHSALCDLLERAVGVTLPWPVAMKLRSLLVVSLLFAAGCGERPLEPRDPTPGVPHYRFATFNVAFPKAGEPSTTSAVGATGADVIALQETNSQWRKALEERYADSYPYMLFHELDGPDGLAVLSRFPLEDRGFLPGPDGWHPAWHVLVSTPAGTVQLLNVHLRAFFDGGGNPVSSYLSTQSDHLYEMKLFVEQCAEGYPSLVLGDFNEDPDGKAVEFLESKGYRNALPLYHPGQPTWKGRSVAGQMDMTIDHVMFDGSFEPLNAWVDGGGKSDHLPVVAHLEASGGWPAASTSGPTPADQNWYATAPP